MRGCFFAELVKLCNTKGYIGFLVAGRMLLCTRVLLGWHKLARLAVSMAPLVQLWQIPMVATQAHG